MLCGMIFRILRHNRSLPNPDALVNSYSVLSIDQQVGDFYESGMDLAGIDPRGYQSVKPIRNRVKRAEVFIYLKTGLKVNEVAVPNSAPPKTSLG
jgi:hypothetical protein